VGLLKATEILQVVTSTTRGESVPIGGQIEGVVCSFPLWFATRNWTFITFAYLTTKLGNWYVDRGRRWVGIRWSLRETGVSHYQ